MKKNQKNDGHAQLYAHDNAMSLPAIDLSFVSSDDDYGFTMSIKTAAIATGVTPDEIRAVVAPGDIVEVHNESEVEEHVTRNAFKALSYAATHPAGREFARAAFAFSPSW